MNRHGVRLAAFIADSLFSSDGIRPDPTGFLRPVADAVREAGGLYIADEVQPGFGRTGAAMWGFQRHGIVPDLAVMGKPMGNGMPIAGVAARPEILAEFGSKIRYFNTFGGNSVCIAAAAAVLDVIETESLLANALAVGGYLRDTLEAIARDTPRISAVRGAGLYAAADFTEPGTGEPDGDTAIRVVNGLRERRVLVSARASSGVSGESCPVATAMSQAWMAASSAAAPAAPAGAIGPDGSGVGTDSASALTPVQAAADPSSAAAVYASGSAPSCPDGANGFCPDGS